MLLSLHQSRINSVSSSIKAFSFVLSISSKFGGNSISPHIDYPCSAGSTHRHSVWPKGRDGNSPAQSLPKKLKCNSRGQMRQTEPRARKSGILRGRPSAGTIDMLRRMIIRPYGSVNVSSFPLIILFSHHLILSSSYSLILTISPAISKKFVLLPTCFENG